MHHENPKCVYGSYRENGHIYLFLSRHDVTSQHEEPLPRHCGSILFFGQEIIGFSLFCPVCIKHRANINTSQCDLKALVEKLGCNFWGNYYLKIRELPHLCDAFI